jgi:hypothetical protein
MHGQQLLFSFNRQINRTTTNTHNFFFCYTKTKVINNRYESKVETMTSVERKRKTEFVVCQEKKKKKKGKSFVN